MYSPHKSKVENFCIELLQDKIKIMEKIVLSERKNKILCSLVMPLLSYCTKKK